MDYQTIEKRIFKHRYDSMEAIRSILRNTLSREQALFALSCLVSYTMWIRADEEDTRHLQKLYLDKVAEIMYSLKIRTSELWSASQLTPYMTVNPYDYARFVKYIEGNFIDRSFSRTKSMMGFKSRSGRRLRRKSR